VSQGGNRKKAKRSGHSTYHRLANVQRRFAEVTVWVSQTRAHNVRAAQNKLDGTLVHLQSREKVRKAMDKFERREPRTVPLLEKEELLLHGHNGNVIVAGSQKVSVMFQKEGARTSKERKRKPPPRENPGTAGVDKQYERAYHFTSSKFPFFGITISKTSSTSSPY
jgi:hypothetical protein